LAKLDVLIRKLESIGTLTDEQRTALAHLEGSVLRLRRGQDVVREGERPRNCTLVLSGILSRYKHNGGGKRQILAMHTPGDLPDIHSLFLDVMDHNLGATADCEVMAIPHEGMRDLISSHPALAQLLWRDSLIDAAIFREWTLNVGARSAYKRIAHLLCELLTRLQAVGLAQGNSCDLALTQEDIGDATGLTNVHVSRTLGDLRKEGIVDMSRGTLAVQDWERLKQAGEFDPMYLHIHGLPGASGHATPFP
jgi:CRP-like cAMP-binding protein